MNNNGRMAILAIIVMATATALFRSVSDILSGVTYYDMDLQGVAVFNILLAAGAALGFMILNARFVKRDGLHSPLLELAGRVPATVIMNMIPLAYGVLQIAYYTGSFPIWSDLMAKILLGLQGVLSISMMQARDRG